VVTGGKNKKLPSMVNQKRESLREKGVKKTYPLPFGIKGKETNRSLLPVRVPTNRNPERKRKNCRRCCPDGIKRNKEETLGRGGGGKRRRGSFFRYTTTTSKQKKKEEKPKDHPTITTRGRP